MNLTESAELTSFKQSSIRDKIHKPRYPESADAPDPGLQMRFSNFVILRLEPGIWTDPRIGS